MTWFRDLSPYTYLQGADIENGTDTVLNVGWLARGEPFETGLVGGRLAQEMFLLRLQVMASMPVYGCMGYHRCDLCDTEGPLGNGEVRVWSPERAVTYVAPAMIPHYVEAHQYRPPDAFVDAVLAGRVEVPDPHAVGDELSQYCSREQLDDHHQAVAAEIVAEKGDLPTDLVRENISFFVEFVNVCEDPGGWAPNEGGLPRMWVGWTMSGMSHIWTGEGHWDGTAAMLRKIARTSINQYTLDKLRMSAQSRHT